MRVIAYLFFCVHVLAWRMPALNLEFGKPLRADKP
jgi:hypothetical protein